MISKSIKTTKDKEPDVIDKMLEGIDFSGLSQEEILGRDGLIKSLTRKILNRALEAEMETMLGYKKNSIEGNNSGNSRNGYSKKSVLAGDQEIEIEIPRDRNGEFKPLIVPKYQKRLPVFNDQIIALYSRGMTTRDIQGYLREMYSVDVSPELISNVTAAVNDEVQEWRKRPLEEVYTFVYLDALRVNSREDGSNKNKALYVALGVNLEGKKSVLGFYMNETEGAKFWMTVLNDLKNRGVKDILIACMDGLTGFPEAVRAIYPNTRVQLCIVHMIRNSTRFVSYKDLKAVCKDLKEIYGASNEEAAIEALEAFGDKWDSKYPMIKKSWESKWNDLCAIFEYPEEIRKVIYTTNSIESLNFSLRKVTKNRAAFPNDESVYKIMYLAIKNIEQRWTLPIRNWSSIINQLTILFGERVKI